MQCSVQDTVHLSASFVEGSSRRIPWSLHPGVVEGPVCEQDGPTQTQGVCDDPCHQGFVLQQLC